MAQHRMRHPVLTQLSDELRRDDLNPIEAAGWFAAALVITLAVLLVSINLGAHPLASPLAVLVGVVLFRACEIVASVTNDVAGWIRHAR